MSTSAIAVLCDCSTDANFRAWGILFESIFETGGFWQRTADTGQVNWATVLSPAAGADGGYEIYETIDALSSSFKLYMRVVYGCNAFGAPKGPRISFRFGTGTDGAGNLTGNVSAVYQGNPGAVGAGVATSTCYASGAAGRFGVLLWNTTVSSEYPICLTVERSLDAAGAYTADYFTWTIGYRNNGGGSPADFAQRVIRKPSIGTFGPASTSAFTLFLSGATAAMGSFAAPFPVFPFLGFPDNPMTAVMGMKSGDISEGGTFDVTMYGAACHYLWTARGLGCWLGPSVALGFGMRYE